MSYGSIERNVGTQLATDYEWGIYVGSSTIKAGTGFAMVNNVVLLSLP